MVIRPGPRLLPALKASEGNPPWLIMTSFPFPTLLPALPVNDALLEPLGMKGLVERPCTIGFSKRNPKFWLNFRKSMALSL